MNKSYKRQWSVSEIKKVETNIELLDKVLSKENLNKTYKQVYQNKGARGVDGVIVDELFAYIKEHSEEIFWQIRNRKYKQQPVRRVYISKDNGKCENLVYQVLYIQYCNKQYLKKD